MIQPKLSALLVLMTCNAITFSYPTGAPTSACETMMPRHGSIVPQPNPSPYIMKINSSSYQSGRSIQVQIMGPPYKGLLLQARTQSNTVLYGTWLQPPQNTKILACPGNTLGAITHSNANLKDQSTTYIWMPPKSDCPNVLYFVATVVEAFDVYWLGVRSALITKAPGETCSSQIGLASDGMALQPVIYFILCLQLVFFVV
ncbi:putative defense protein 3 [Hyla sarda]|uniref:putative defense protein 3 n=1 Tax=Hyla sarda TaxID=327740 RepID=UPI0024C232BD|nr:putative defense protein 3 [Hyla sarda]